MSHRLLLTLAPDREVADRQRGRVNPLWTVTEMDDTHMVNLNDPQGTAEALMSLL